MSSKSQGGAGRFLLGLVMLIMGSYLFLNSIQVINQMSWGMSLYSMGNFKVTPGLTLVPFFIWYWNDVL